jgi:hypothetical protein
MMDSIDSKKKKTENNFTAVISSAVCGLLFSLPLGVLLLALRRGTFIAF